MFSKLLTASVLSRTCDEDLCSQLNYLWSAYVIGAMGALITMVQYAGNPIYCWCPAEMPQVQCNYTMALCWVKENYYVSEENSIQFQGKDRYNLKIAYYPWVPWILFFMAAMLNLPHIIWRAFVPASGLDLSKLVNLADSDDSVDNLATILRIWLVKVDISRNIRFNLAKSFIGSLGVFPLGKHRRTYLCGLVLLVKLLYLVVSVGLFMGLNIFIDDDFFMYGYDVLENFLKGIPQSSIRFPRETVCDMNIRQMTYVHTYSIQCILPINLYNEHIFIFLWFFLLTLICFNAYSLLGWATHLLSPTSRRAFVKGYVVIVFHLLKKQNSRSDHKKENPGFRRNSVDANNNKVIASKEAINGCQGGRNKIITNNGRSKVRDTINNAKKDIVVSEKNETILSEPGMRHCLVLRAKRKALRRIKDLVSPKADLIGDTPRATIETTHYELIQDKRKRKINRMTSSMLKHIGHDGIVVFRTLEDAVGIVIASEIFQVLYQQLTDDHHYG